MKRKYLVLGVVCFWVLLLDQWTKHLVQERLFLHQTVEIIPKFFNLIHVRNTGGAFGIFGGERGGIGSRLFVIISLIAIGAILFLLVKTREDEKTLFFSLSLVSVTSSRTPEIPEFDSFNISCIFFKFCFTNNS